VNSRPSAIRGGQSKCLFSDVRVQEVQLRDGSVELAAAAMYVLFMSMKMSYDVEMLRSTELTDSCVCVCVVVKLGAII
jgi:hypothetical protein